jgi:predicted metalloenzyme YecM
MADKESMTEVLERLIDKNSLLDVLIGLELVCSEKAAHIAENYQDKKLAAKWNRASARCGQLARDEAIQAIP